MLCQYKVSSVLVELNKTRSNRFLSRTDLKPTALTTTGTHQGELFPSDSIFSHNRGSYCNDNFEREKEKKRALSAILNNLYTIFKSQPVQDFTSYMQKNLCTKCAYFDKRISQCESHFTCTSISLYGRNHKKKKNRKRGTK